MPLNTGAAIAVSLIPAAVILVYNLMENGAPGGNLNELVSKDLSGAGSASSISLQNISIITTGLNENNSKHVNDKIIEEARLRATTIIQRLMIAAATTPSIGAGTSTTASVTTTTTTTTTPAPIPTFNYPKLPVCCDSVRAVGNRVVGHCASNTLHDFILVSTQDGAWKVPSGLMSTGETAKFSLQTSTPGCRDTIVSQLPISGSVTSHFLADGMLKYENEYYRKDEYCINGKGENQEHLEIKTCKIDCNDPDTPCVHKCCGYDEIYSMGMHGQRGGCLRMDSTRNESIWAPTLYNDMGERLSVMQLAAAGIKPHVIQSNPTSFRHTCPRNATTVFPYGKQVADFLGAVLRYPFSALKFMMRQDGWLMNPIENRNIAISKSKRTTKYCIDGVQNYGETSPFLNLEDQTVLFLCLGAAEELIAEREREKQSENLIVSASNYQPSSTLPPPPSLITTITTKKPTTTTEATTTTPTTTTTEATTTTTKPTTTSTTTTTEKPTTTTEKVTTAQTTTTATTTTTERLTTTQLPTTTFSSITTMEPHQSSAPVLPVCCPLNPDADDDTGNEISHHCKTFPSNIDNTLQRADNSTSNLWIASPNFMFTHKITKFRLKVKPLGCEKWTKAFVHNLGKLLSPTEPVLMPNGMLKMGNDYYQNGEFCVNGVFPNIVEVLVCKTNCSDPRTPCIQKCCAPNEVYSLGVGGKKRGCIPLAKEDTPFNPPLYANMTTKVTTTELESMSPHLVQKYPPKFQYDCYKNVTLVFPFSSDVVQLMNPLAQINLEFKLRQDGKVIYKHPSIRDATGDLIESAFSTYNFCVDGIRNFGEPKGPYTNQEDQTILFVCAVNPPGKT